MGLLVGLALIALASSGGAAEPASDPVKAAGVRWADCAFAAAKRSSDLDEPAESVANAALGSCKQDEASVRKAVIAANGYTSADETMARAVADHHQSLVAFVMDNRLQRRASAMTKK